jgi:hypothetical protein
LADITAKQTELLAAAEAELETPALPQRLADADALSEGGFKLAY